MAASRVGRLAGLAALALFGTVAANGQPAPTEEGNGVSFSNFRDASLLDVVEVLARRLGINYIVDPAVRDGSVTINTYGQLDGDNLLAVLETVLEMNGAAAVQAGEIYHIVPLDNLAQSAGVRVVSGEGLPQDEQFVLNALRPSYTSADQLAAILDPFLGPAAEYSVVPSANTLLLLDSRRNMQRTLELIAMFDVPELEGQAMRIFEIENSLATNVVEELRNIQHTLSPDERTGDLRFLALPRIGALLAVGSSEESLETAETWVRRLDRASTAGGRRNFVYRVQYGEASNLAGTLTQLYLQAAAPGGGLPAAGDGDFAAPVAGTGYQTGSALEEPTIRIVPDTVNNLVLVQATQQEWEAIHGTLLELDVPPRQVLITARIYEVSLSGALSTGVSAYLRNRSGAAASRRATGGFGPSGATALSIGMLVGSTRELALFLEGSAAEGRTRVISAPTLVATDNVPAEIVVGKTVPTLSSQAVVGGTFSEGSSLFTNTISNVQTGVRLSVTARVNASGIVTLEILQEVSTPTGITGTIQSPTIDRRNVSTQVTVRDGDTVAIGGIIQETRIYESERVPVLGRIPVLGRAFGGTSESTSKTELIVLLEPRVIYDQNGITSATEELRSSMEALRRFARRTDKDQKRSE